MSSSRADLPQVTVIVPIKRLGTAKTRTHLSAHERAGLALDLMSGTVRAALAATAVARVIVVTADQDAAAAATALGAVVVPEPEIGGLNQALAAGREYACGQFPDADVALVVGDLAALRPEDLDTVVAEFRTTREPLLVADHLGTGTTMLMHDPSTAPPLLFGPDSASRHQGAGYRLFPGAPASTRHDVDSPADVEGLIQASR